MLIDLTEPNEATGLRFAVDAVQALLEQLAVDPPPDDALATWAHARPQAIKDAVQAIAALEAPLRKAIADAFSHDISFSHSLADDHFRFALAQLPVVAFTAAKDLLVAMYERVFRGSGFTFADGSKLTPASFEYAFCETNRVSVCPACLIGTLELQTGGSPLYDLEHAFPKSLYPALAVHHHNLVPECMPCNQREHRNADPLDSPDAPLASAYVPYMRSAARELQVEFEPLGSEDRRVKLHGTDAAAERRVRGHVRLYNLDRRWSVRLEGIHSHIRDEVIDRCPQNRQDVEQVLLHLAQRLRPRAALATDALLEAEYCEWLARRDLDAFALEVLGAGA